MLALLAIWVLLMSLVTFGLYGLDKRRAQTKRWRIPESTLLGAGLLGGWPGGLLAQRIFRHKTRKTNFQLSYWLTVAINVVATVTLIAQFSRS